MFRKPPREFGRQQDWPCTLSDTDRPTGGGDVLLGSIPSKRDRIMRAVGQENICQRHGPVMVRCLRQTSRDDARRSGGSPGEPFGFFMLVWMSFWLNPVALRPPSKRPHKYGNRNGHQ